MNFLRTGDSDLLEEMAADLEAGKFGDIEHNATALAKSLREIAKRLAPQAVPASVPRFRRPNLGPPFDNAYPDNGDD